MLNSNPQELIPDGKGLEAKCAPIGGPMQKQIAKAIPTCARALDRLAAVVTSERMALNTKDQGEPGAKVTSQSLHGELNVAFAQTSDNTGQKVGRKGC